VIEAIPKMSERYWFWTGNGKAQTGIGDWQGRLLDLFKDMKVKQFARANKITAPKQLEAKGAASSQRGTRIVSATFAVELLLAGVPLERVSILPGQSSVKIREKHYAPWVRERQEQAEVHEKHGPGN
jgi:integrase/recombinase XerD